MLILGALDFKLHRVTYQKKLDHWVIIFTGFLSVTLFKLSYASKGLNFVPNYEIVLNLKI